ncbi:isochorismatase domain-containing protein 1-like [Musca domestica]|uniref:Isochorismatase domain-containing protein 1 n=2 Tax=Musca domestica TaxID=7370 RepID=A0A1I8MCA0_MUSDO|nr:isochorismatase domain-containing protein 1-like [Musca domestica]XP_058987249.1 isochorismatase domain-containing protein 1-like [Musca domestica]XP_058987250.1 isochorismatase domain-containing protein 1-like [Musca domestica]
MTSRLRHLNPKKTLFLLCDIQEKFRPGMPLFSNAVVNASKLTKAGKELNIPLICTEHYPERLGKIVSDIDVSHAKAVFPKTRFSMIIPELEAKVKEIFGDKPDDVVLYGLESHICVEQTAIDLLEKKINVFLVADCLISRLNQDRDLAIERLRNAGCVVTTSESVIFDLMGDKNHPKFDVVRKFVNTPSADMQLAKAAKL